MAQQSPWSVKGVRPECRVAAKVAARRSGMTIGEWLNRAIMDAAKESIQGQEPEQANHQLPALPLNELAQAIEALGEHIQKQNERMDAVAGLDRAEVEERVAPVADSVRQLEEEVEAKFEALQTGEYVGAMQQRVQEAEAKAERANLTVAPLERKVMRMAQQLEQREAEAQQDAPRRGLLSRLFGG